MGYGGIQLDAPGVLHHLIIRGIERLRSEENVCGIFDLSAESIYSKSREKAKMEPMIYFAFFVNRIQPVGPG